MASENWQERLEAYLDGELDTAAAAAFEAETTSSSELQAELAARRRFRAVTRDILREEAVPTLALDARHARGAVRRRNRNLAAMVAVAAALCLILLAPPLARRASTASVLRGGPVVAVRFGDVAGATVILEVGCYDQSTGTVH